ncbi:MAG: sugar nucleotide-binding protein, partial [Mucispirillum sp.]|nr:sugar nucleotide-binding protein [Mucispirillum sp.]
VCIAEPNIDRCYKYYDQAYEINVLKTQKLIHELSAEGFQIIFFSTDNVFDGADGNYTEESKLHAINKYGMMKAEMEHYLLTYKPEVCILRIPKVVSTSRKKHNIFTEWEQGIETGNIRCIKGNRLSFVCIDDLYNACLLVAGKKLHGLYNIVGDEVYSRAELARIFCAQLGATAVDIQECDLSEFSFKDNRPLNISMINEKFKKETGYQFMSMELVIKMYCDYIQ